MSLTIIFSFQNRVPGPLVRRFEMRHVMSIGHLRGATP